MSQVDQVRNATTPAIPAPRSIEAEHRELHAVLRQATEERGALGAAARELADLFEPHFRREEQIASPPLGLLTALATAAPTPDMREILPVTRALERELPKMLQEHFDIEVARHRFDHEARRAGRPEYSELAHQLARHAKLEEEVLYPAAVLVGRYIEAMTATAGAPASSLQGAPGY
jgi:hypothetical protein